MRRERKIRIMTRSKKESPKLPYRSSNEREKKESPMVYDIGAKWGRKSYKHNTTEPPTRSDARERQVRGERVLSKEKKE